MKRLFIHALVVSSIVFNLPMARAESDTPKDKSGYTLFCPTPDSQMRDWRTDVLAVSPYTVDAGHFEIQLNAVSYAMGSGTILVITPTFVQLWSSDVDEWTYGAFVAKAGLLNNLDVEVSFVPYRTITFKRVPTGFGIGRATRSGSGDTDAGLKWNIWGNDGGKTALSLSGAVIFPTGTGDFSDDIYAGGPMLEFQTELPWEFVMRINSGAVLYEATSLASLSINGPRTDGIQANVLNRISISRPIVRDLVAYAGFDSEVSTARNDWAGFAQVALTYRFVDNVEFFIGSSFKVAGDPAVSDYSPFVGINARF